MSSHNVTVAVFVLIGLVVGVLEYLGRRPDPAVPTLSQVFTAVMSTPIGRASTLVGWVWAGYHFFAR
ncbi:MAG TPA: DUF6186 family protein [Mycobacteriales bacterium]|jgi:hypothetical protein